MARKITALPPNCATCGVRVRWTDWDILTTKYFCPAHAWWTQLQTVDPVRQTETQE